MIDITKRSVWLVLSILLARAATAGPCDGVSHSTNTQLRSTVVVTGLTGKPLYVTAPPGDTSRIFTVEQNGFVRIHKHGDPATTTTLFLDISAKLGGTTAFNEMGFLGMTFDPDYATNGRFYVFYTEGPLAGPWFTVIARYNVSSNPDQADPLSELRIIRFQDPETNHKAGQLQFGPDGFLYINVGDGGGGGDQHGTCGNGQSKNTLLGKILRLDVRNVDPNAVAPDCGAVPGNYKIPFSNPFRDGLGGNCDEIWEYGFRNPWRSSFDPATGDHYIGEVGQNCWEEIDWVAAATGAGLNFGWRQMEGTHCFDTNQQSNCNPAPVACGTSPACHDPSLVLPILEYGHTGSPAPCAVTGGYVYRGCRMTSFLGTYFYGDYCAGTVKSFVNVGGTPTSPADWTSSVDPTTTLANGLSSFGVDAQGEVYITDNSGTGQVLKLVPPFPNLEVSGDGAGSVLLLDKTGDWTWEDLFRSTDVPVSFYRVYRGTPNGHFDCVLKTTVPKWPAGGDPAAPAADQLFAYLVTAVNASSEETATGHPGTFNAASCP
jgi:glucose/arabinose dehydrogenase